MKAANLKEKKWTGQMTVWWCREVRNQSKPFAILQKQNYLEAPLFFGALFRFGEPALCLVTDTVAVWDTIGAAATDVSLPTPG